LVLAGIPDAATRPITDPKPAPLVQVSQVNDGETATEVFAAPGLPAQAPAEVVAAVPAPSRRKYARWVVAATATVVAGVLTGVIATATPRDARTAGNAASTASGSPVNETTPSASAPTASPTPEVGAVLPASDPLAGQQFIIPRGNDDATQLNLANIAGVVGPHRLSNAGGRNSWPMLSADRRTIIYILTTRTCSMSTVAGRDRLGLTPTWSSRPPGRTAERSVACDVAAALIDSHLAVRVVGRVQIACLVQGSVFLGRQV